MTFHYVWLVWSSAFLLPWVLLCRLFPQHRPVMWRASLFMLPFGLTEPIFVPEYWNPPSLFELAQKTGFDIESFIFSFAIGGIAAVLYNIIMHKLDRFHLVIDTIDRLPQNLDKTTIDKSIVLKQQLKKKLVEHKQYINKNGQDMPEIRNWKWSDAK